MNGTRNVRAAARIALLQCLMGFATAAAAAPIDVPAGWRYGPPPAPAPGDARKIAAAPDGDETDPAIVAQAAALGHDPARIFAFVRDDVGIDPYVGSLRGARGALAGRAGNALDRASLTIALLRASGFTARYAQGELAYADAQRVVARVFPDARRFVGCNNPGARADGRNDYNLIAPAQAHTWVQYQAVASGPWIALDTAFADAAPGQFFASATVTFDAVPAAQQHRVRVRVVAETWSQAGAIYGFGLGSSTVLDVTYPAADLVDRPLTLGHFVAHNAPPALAIGSITNTYSPYLLVANPALDPSGYPVVRGTDYVETFTNFPLGTVLLTGVFAVVDVTSPQDPQNPRTFQRVLVDRIGYATRVNGGSVQAPDSNAPPALAPLDLTTIQVSPSQQPLDGFAARRTRLEALQAQTAALAPAIAALPPPAQQSPAQIGLRTQAADLNRRAVIAILELLTASFEGAASRADEEAAATFLTRAWIDSPRLTVASARAGADTLGFALDIRKNDLRVYPHQGIAWTNTAHFERARGLQESLLEAQVLTAVTGQPAASFASLFGANDADLVPITRYDVTRVDDLALSPEAKARIRETVTGFNGRSVLAPRAPVMVGGRPYSIWLETDPNTGYTISTGEDGTHQALGEYGGLLLTLFGVDSLETQMAKFIGQVNAAGVVGVAFTAAVVQAVASGGAFGDLGQAVKAILNDATGPLANIMEMLENSGASELCEGGCGLVQNMLSGLLDGIKTLRSAITSGDPPVPSILIAPPVPPLPADVAPGATPGVAVDVVADPRWFVPYNGAELPFVYLAKITNTGPATDTFRIDNAGAGNGYGLFLAMTQITLRPGQSGEVGLCIAPGGALPAPGTPVPFNVHVYSPANPAADTTSANTNTTPPAQALRLRALPAGASVRAGQNATTTLTLDALGNVPTVATLTATNDAHLGVTGLPADVALAAGESRSLPLTYTVGAGATSGTSLVSVLRGDLGGVEPATTRFTAHVTSSLTTCTSQAALDATRLGRGSMGATLARLAGTMDVLAGRPDDAGALAAALAELDDLTHNQFNTTIFATLTATVTAARTQLANAAVSGMPAALAAVDASLCALGDALVEAASGEMSLTLQPQLAVNPPAQATVVNIQLYNDTSGPRTFDIAIDGVPANVQAVLSATTVNLGSRGLTNGCCGAPTLSVTFTNADGQARAFDYRVTATPRDLPQIARSVVGGVALRPDIARVASVRASPFAATPGQPVTVSTRVMNSANGYRNVFGGWTLRDATGATRRSGSTDAKLLAPGDGIVALNDFTIDTTGLNGALTLEMGLVDASRCCDAIPGSFASGALIVGAPFSAQLSATPATVPPGTSTIAYALTLSRESAPTPVIDPRASLAMPASTRSFAQRGRYLYVCQRDRVTIVDVATPAAPVVAGTFATDALATGYANVGCNLDGDVLVLAYNLSSPSSFDDLKLVAYRVDDAHATAPLRLNPTPVSIPKRFGGTIRFNDSHIGSLTTAAMLYNPFSGFVFQQNGNLVSLDFSTPASPAPAGELFHHFGPTDTNDPIYGGPNMIFSSLPRGTTTLLASTSAVGDGFGTGPGVGRIAAADVAQLPTNCPGAPNPCVTGTTDVPGTRVLFGIAAQGDAGLAAGDTDGAYDGYSGFVGNLTLSALDLSGALPAVRSTLTSLMLNRRPAGGACNQPLDTGGTTLSALTGNYYAVGAFNPLSCAWVLAIVDANDPAHLAVIPYDVPSPLRNVLLDGNTLYALTDTAILVYDYAVIAGPAITVRVDIPKNTGVAIVPGSFSVPPTGVDTSAAEYDRYTWYRPTANAIAWQGQVTGMTPGELRAVAAGGRVDYTLPAIGSGSVALERVAVSADQTLAIVPARQGATLGDPLTYAIVLTNPGASAVTYDLSLSGVPDAWRESLATPVTVPAHGQASANLVLRATPGDPQYADFPFTVTGTVRGGFTTSGSAVFGTGGRNVGGDPNTPILASTVTVLTDPVTAGRGDVAPVTLRVANVGNVAQNYNVGLASAPPGLGLAFVQPNFTLNAGATKDVAGTVSVATNVAPGSYAVAPLVNSFAGNQTASLTVNVPGPGVFVALTPGSGTAATAYTARITNTGTANDTFDLRALGPLGPAVTLAPDVVALAPGEARDVTATLAGTGYLPPGTSTFDVEAVSRAVGAVRARATATVTLAGSKAVALRGVPASVTAPNLPATASFGVRVVNAGNVEDVYRLALAGTTGNVTASLYDAGGAPAAAVEPIRLPGNAAAQFRVDATLAAGGSEAGSVTLTATSTSDAAVQATIVLAFSRNGAANLILGSPGAIDFGDQALASTSAVRSATLVNSGPGDFVIGSVSVAGANAADFALAAGAGSCVGGTTIAANGGSCTVYARFAPTALGARAARIDVAGNGAPTVAIPLSGTGVEGTQLSAELTANRPYVQYLRTLSWLVTARNPGTTPVAGVDVALPLPPQIEPASATWFCINASDPNTHCATAGSGALADHDVLIPAQGSVSYVVSGTVRSSVADERIVATTTVASVADPTPRNASAATQIVVFRDGFQPFGDGASTLVAAGTLATDGSVALRVAPPATPHAIDTVVRGRNGPDAFRVERVGYAARYWLRLVAERADGDTAGRWIAVPFDGVVELGAVTREDGVELLLRAGDGESRVVLPPAALRSYALEVASDATLAVAD
ncbi:transglutaminase domain-containing protein [Tahibacter soli]|uniref:Transglutaminase domain-containing protein n=1 Tax=Tahibacter soli TaxID=2983605 RepID=A0A9X4BK18_9GAMM|nr:transglutaminase domain-containing protein [Tahibacter soli]MDC8012749.1 transglutaminase domain-containing protein [Tahibacter soli]